MPSIEETYNLSLVELGLLILTNDGTGPTPLVKENNIEWNDNMNDFDLLLATSTQPKPLTLATAKEIVEKIKETGNDEYFINN